MSQKRIKRSIIISADNNQCNCFGKTDQTQQLFLSKNKSLEIKNKPSPPPLVHLPEQDIPLKNFGKKSLRKNNSPSNYALTSRTKDEYYNGLQTPPLKKQFRQFRSDQLIRSPNKNNLERFYNTQQRRPIQQPFIRNIDQKLPPWIPTANQSYYHPQPIPISPQRFIITHNQPQALRISFSKSPPSHLYTPQMSSRQPPRVQRPIPIPFKKITSLKEIKEEVVINIKKQVKNEKPISKQSYSRCNQQEVIQFQLTEDNIDSPRLMPIEKKTSVDYLKSEYTFQNQLPVSKQKRNELNVGVQTFKSKNIKPKSKSKNERDTYKSKIQMPKNSNVWKSTTGNISETPRLKLGVKSLKQQKKSLKKMDDVEEIHSLGGSEKQEDDKQSVVLGRLREYGSMLDPTLSLTTPTLGSKLNSMNTQSSVGRSFMKSFQFMSEKNIYK